MQFRIWRISRKPFLLATLVSGVIGIVVLMWPAATWLQGRELWVRPTDPVDALYLVAGARDQDRRIRGLIQYCKLREVADAGMPVILVSNDREVRYDIPQRYAGRMLVDLAQVKIPALLGCVLEAKTVPDVRSVPGIFYGTDGEMAMLAAYLNGQPAIRRLAVSTSPYHVRRVVLRLQAHQRDDIEIRVIRLRPGWRDRNPVLVLSELVKMVRDALGLSAAPVISRGWWIERRRD